MTAQYHLTKFIEEIPKAELHVHIEGTLEPELLFSIALRNNVELPYTTVDELRKAYNFNNLQDFLDIYYKGAAVLIKEIDFYDLTFDYLSKLHQQHVSHVEIMFDPQTHTSRGISFETVITGITRALAEAKEKWGITSHLILSFLRHLSEDDAFVTLREALPYKKHFVAVGLDSSELGHPPKKFERVFKLAQEEGLLAVAHAGEEGPASNIYDSLDFLNVSRIDHGNSTMDDTALIERLVLEQKALTLCPLSNLSLKVINTLKAHPLRQMLNKGLLVTINSDDPAYFGGHLNDNYIRTAQALELTKEDIVTLAINSFSGSFLSQVAKTEAIKKINTYANQAFIDLV